MLSTVQLFKHLVQLLYITTIFYKNKNEVSEYYKLL